MKGILPDVNIEGHFRHLVSSFFESSGWADVWSSLDLRIVTFDMLGLEKRDPDDLIWQACQREELLFLTGNRNDDGPRSLATTIREQGTPESLPVITVSNVFRFRDDKPYIARIGERLPEICMDIELNRGAGRLYVP